MDFVLQVAVIAATFVIATIVLFFFVIKKFSLSKNFLLLVLFPVFIFSLGFSLRLSGFPSLVDMGFFFTEMNYVFFYAIFAAAWLLGQSKYHKVII